MFCGVKLEITDKVLYEKLYANPLLDFHSKVDQEGIISEWSECKFKNLKFKIHSIGRIEISGSLHTFWNDGEHNYNDFTIAHLEKAIGKLREIFNINPYTARISRLEYGFNITTIFDPSRFIKSLICYRFKNFNLSHNKMFFGKYCEMGQYTFKIYNKGKQFGQPSNILRIEKSIKKMEVLRKGPIYLIDLLNTDLQASCLKQVLDAFDHVLFNETFDKALLTKPQAKVYDTVAIEINRWDTMNSKKRHDVKRVFCNIINSLGHDNFGPTIKDLINDKYKSLIKSGNVLTGYKSENRNVLTHLIQGQNYPY